MNRDRAFALILLLAPGGFACSVLEPADPVLLEARAAVDVLARLNEQYELLGADEHAVQTCRGELQEVLGALDAGDSEAARRSLGRGLNCTADVGETVTDRIERLRTEGGPDPLSLLGREVDLGDGFYTLVGVRVQERRGVQVYKLNLRSATGLHQTRTLRLR